MIFYLIVIFSMLSFRSIRFFIRSITSLAINDDLNVQYVMNAMNGKG